MNLRTVEDVMVRDVEVIRSDADIHELEKKLLQDGIHGMPVVDENDTLVGVVSQTDLVAWHYFNGVDGSSGNRNTTTSPRSGEPSSITFLSVIGSRMP